jgi:hypothetical protein
MVSGAACVAAADVAVFTSARFAPDAAFNGSEPEFGHEEIGCELEPIILDDYIKS